MNDYKEYNDRLFSRWAPVYDGFELILSGIRDSMTEQIDPTGKKVLDVATGTGSLAIALSRSAKEVIGIDLSPRMLAVAERKRRPDNLSFLLMDASRMTFADGEFDVATISLGLHDMPLDIRTLVLHEVKRVLKKGGRLFILEYDLPSNRLAASVSSRLLNTFESRYYLDFVHSDLDSYLQGFGFKVEKKTDFLFHHLQLIQLTA